MSNKEFLEKYIETLSQILYSDLNPRITTGNFIFKESIKIKDGTTNINAEIMFVEKF